MKFFEVRKQLSKFVVYTNDKITADYLQENSLFKLIATYTDAKNNTACGWDLVFILPTNCKQNLKTAKEFVREVILECKKQKLQKMINKNV